MIAESRPTISAWERLDCPLKKASWISEIDNWILVLDGTRILVTNDNGKTWDKLAGRQNPDEQPLRFVSTKGTWFSKSDVGILANNEMSGKELGCSGLGQGDTVNALAQIGNSIFAATLDGIYKSANEGVNWSPAPDPLPDPSAESHSVDDLLEVGASLFALSNGMVFRSDDNAENWYKVGGAWRMPMKSAVLPQTAKRCSQRRARPDWMIWRTKSR